MPDATPPVYTPGSIDSGLHTGPFREESTWVLQRVFFGSYACQDSIRRDRKYICPPPQAILILQLLQRDALRLQTCLLKKGPYRIEFVLGERKNSSSREASLCIESVILSSQLPDCLILSMHYQRMRLLPLDITGLETTPDSLRCKIYDEHNYGCDCRCQILISVYNDWRSRHRYSILLTTDGTIVPPTFEPACEKREPLSKAVLLLCSPC